MDLLLNTFKYFVLLFYISPFFNVGIQEVTPQISVCADQLMTHMDEIYSDTIFSYYNSKKTTTIDDIDIVLGRISRVKNLDDIETELMWVERDINVFQKQKSKIIQLQKNIGDKINKGKAAFTQKNYIKQRIHLLKEKIKRFQIKVENTETKEVIVYFHQMKSKWLQALLAIENMLSQIHASQISNEIKPKVVGFLLRQNFSLWFRVRMSHEIEQHQININPNVKGLLLLKQPDLHFNGIYIDGVWSADSFEREEYSLLIENNQLEFIYKQNSLDAIEEKRLQIIDHFIAFHNKLQKLLRLEFSSHAPLLDYSDIENLELSTLGALQKKSTLSRLENSIETVSKIIEENQGIIHSNTIFGYDCKNDLLQKYNSIMDRFKNKLLEIQKSANESEMAEIELSEKITIIKSDHVENHVNGNNFSIIGRVNHPKYLDKGILFQSPLFSPPLHFSVTWSGPYFKVTIPKASVHMETLNINLCEKERCENLNEKPLDLLSFIILGSITTSIQPGSSK